MKMTKTITLILLLAFTVAACSKVPAGNVGVKVYLLGGKKGVDTEELSPGRYWIGINEELYLFPTFTQNYTWTLSSNEGSPDDESINFQTMEGLSVSADVGISYRIMPDRVSDIFQKYRKGIDEVTDVYLRNMVRDALVLETSTLSMQDVYGVGKADLIRAVEARVVEQVSEIGIEIERVYWIGNLRLPATVVKALNAKIEATQKAQQRQNEVAQAKAEADKKIEEARGVAESHIINANAKATGVIAMAEAEAQAISIKGKALKNNPDLLELSAIEKWDGTLPRFTGGGAIPFINVND